MLSSKLGCSELLRRAFSTPSEREHRVAKSNSASVRVSKTLDDVRALACFSSALSGSQSKSKIKSRLVLLH